MFRMQEKILVLVQEVELHLVIKENQENSNPPPLMVDAYSMIPHYAQRSYVFIATQRLVSPPISARSGYETTYFSCSAATTISKDISSYASLIAFTIALAVTVAD
ncbi:hypothetical protein L6164_014551 [Bauhinia variegata]|uniref:Uncharacterized protein n=1 Tax=Bauhinia variegata TaxID=167791 RepID=A0ACB9NI86_BAUVA|nr:hypothetical protein L6164_014551 [Bauhinia variegata]